MKRYEVAVWSILVCLFSVVIHAKIDVKSMIDGMGQTFGAPPAEYIYNYKVINDAHVRIYIEQQGIASFMGAVFPSAKGYFGKKSAPSIFDAQGSLSEVSYLNQKYYFNMYIGAHESPHGHPIYKESLTQLPLEKHDKKIYYYHAYTAGKFHKGNLVHGPAVEMLGFQDPTQTDTKKAGIQLTGQLSQLNFYNSSGTDVQVSLTYGTTPYTFTVEKYSYNSLSVPTAQPKEDQSSGINEALSAVNGLPGASSVKSSTSKANSGTSSSKKPVAQSQDQVVIQASLHFSADEKEKLTEAQSGEEKESNHSESSENSAEHAEDQQAAQPLFSLRPNTITFAAYNAETKSYKQFRSLQLPSQGFQGYPYTIEIFQDAGEAMEVGIQGLSSGNYTQGVTERIRDITPCPCTFWYQSIQQAGVKSTDGYIDLPGQVWVVYQSADSLVQGKVTPGQVVSWHLTRPLLAEKDQCVYFVYVATTDDAIASKFIAKFVAQLIGPEVITEYSNAIENMVISSATSSISTDLMAENKQVPQAKTLTAEQKVAAMMGSLNVSHGVIKDTQQGVIGYLLGADVFTPQGLGFGRFYYKLSPAMQSITMLVSNLQNYLDSSKTSALGANIQASLTTTVNTWLAAYLTSPSSVENQVKNYLIQYGSSSIVDGKGGLTKFGQNCLQSLLSSSVSLQYPPMKFSTVVNQYVYDFGQKAPDKMPTSVIPLRNMPIEKIVESPTSVPEVSKVSLPVSSEPKTSPLPIVHGPLTAVTAKRKIASF